MRQRNDGTNSRHRLSNMDSQVVLSVPVHLFFESGKIHGVLGVHVDDVIGEVEMRFSTESWRQCAKSLTVEHGMLAIFGFKGRQISQMPNGEIVCGGGTVTSMSLKKLMCLRTTKRCLSVS